MRLVQKDDGQGGAAAVTVANLLEHPEYYLVVNVDQTPQALGKVRLDPGDIVSLAILDTKDSVIIERLLDGLNRGRLRLIDAATIQFPLFMVELDEGERLSIRHKAATVGGTQQPAVSPPPGVTIGPPAAQQPPAAAWGQQAVAPPPPAQGNVPMMATPQGMQPAPQPGAAIPPPPAMVQPPQAAPQAPAQRPSVIPLGEVPVPEVNLGPGTANQ